MKISIVTPSYNYDRFLEETIKSVVEQDYHEFEYIVIDGNSTDKTKNIIKKYEDKISFWVSENDEGQSDAIDKGFLKSTGDILGWINADDKLLPGTLKFVADYFNSHKDIDVLYGDLMHINDEGNDLYTIKSSSFSYWILLYGGFLIPQPATFFRRKMIDQYGLIRKDLHYTMDIEYFIRLASQKTKFQNINKTLSAFRIHSKGKTTEFRNRWWDEFLDIRYEYSKLKINNLFIRRKTFRLLWLIAHLLHKIRLGYEIIDYFIFKTNKNIVKTK